MATAHSKSATKTLKRSHFDVIKNQIIEVFDRILSEVEARRDELLAQVDMMKKKFKRNNASVMESIRELEEMRAQVEKMTVKQNLAIRKQQESLADIDSEIEKVKIGLIDNFAIEFNCSIDQLINQVKQFGNVCNSSTIQSKYCSKLTAVKVVQKHIPKYDTIKLHIDHHKQLLYVYSDESDEYEAPVSVFNAKDFTFIRNFGRKGDVAQFMATGEDFIYVAVSKYDCDTMDVLLYKQSNYSFVQRFTGLNCRMCNIFTNPQNQVFLLVYDDQNYLLCTCDRVVNIEKQVELIYKWPTREPKTLSLLRDERLYILLDKQMLVFDKSGNNIHTIFGKKGKSTLLKNPTSFYICESGYIIITDSGTDSIKFFTSEGDLFHTIGGKTMGSDVVKGACDVVVYKDSMLVSCAGGTIRIY